MTKTAINCTKNKKTKRIREGDVAKNKSFQEKSLETILVASKEKKQK